MSQPNTIPANDEDVPSQNIAHLLQNNARVYNLLVDATKLNTFALLSDKKEVHLLKSWGDHLN